MQLILDSLLSDNIVIKHNTVYASRNAMSLISLRGAFPTSDWLETPPGQLSSNTNILNLLIVV